MTDPWDDIEKLYPIGSIHTGTVTRITKTSVFVKLGKRIYGLIRMNELSWTRTNPMEIVTQGERIKVVVKEFNYRKKLVILGHKQFMQDPWDVLDENLKVGDHVKGEVVLVFKFGALVKIPQGIEGFIHISDMTWDRKHCRLSPKDILQVGEEIEAIILALDRNTYNLNLGLIQLREDPWERIEEKYPLGSKHVAKVVQFVAYGLFARLEEGVEGFVHISNLFWDKIIKHPSKFIEKNASIEVVVLDINKEKRRISLGHKQLFPNPWEHYEAIYTPGSLHLGVLSKIDKQSAIISLIEGGEGFTATEHLVKQDNTPPQVGETLPFVVLTCDKEEQKIILSHIHTYGKKPIKLV